MYRYHSLAMDRRPDAELAERVLARDERALRDAIATYGPLVHGMARRIVNEPSLAEEVAQDTFLAFWRRPGAFDPARGSLQAFLLGVARNKAIDLVRKEESLRRTRDALAAEEQTTSKVTPPPEGIEQRDAVKAALEQLTEVQREALVLAYFGGRTYREVATELGIPEGTAKTRLRDGLTRLREIMSTSAAGGE
jgi:RNA polymerase sigma-70 factor (ECF subfamily)